MGISLTRIVYCITTAQTPVTRDRLTGEMEIVVPESLRDYVIEDIQFVEVIGQGANGSTIVEAKWEGSTVAVKEMRQILNIYTCLHHEQHNRSEN